MKGNFKHGHAPRLNRNPAYNSWQAMRQRCLNPRSASFPEYGGRGITVCEQWNDFLVFLTDVGPKPSPQHTIDRINNDGNYEPENVRWATAKEQSANTRSSLKTQCPSGHLYDEENTRIDKKGWRDCRACDREFYRQKSHRLKLAKGVSV